VANSPMNNIDPNGMGGGPAAQIPSLGYNFIVGGGAGLGTAAAAIGSAILSFGASYFNALASGVTAESLALQAGKAAFGGGQFQASTQQVASSFQGMQFNLTASIVPGLGGGEITPSSGGGGSGKGKLYTVKNAPKISVIKGWFWRLLDEFQGGPRFKY
jgi:hypothetical protein